MELAAIDQLIADGQVTEAVAQLEQALTVEHAPGERFALELKLADILAWYVSDSTGALAHYGVALQVAQEHSLPEIYRAEVGVGQALHQQERADQALLYLEMAAAGASAANDTLTWAAALMLQGNILIEMGEYEEATRLMESIEHSTGEAGELRLQAQAAATLALLNAYMEQYDRAEELGRHAVALAKESGDVGLVAIAYLRMGQIMYQQDRFGPAFYWFKAGGDVAREAGIEHLVQVFDEAVEATGVEPEVHDDNHDHDQDDHDERDGHTDH